jgi:hypothetical protein
VRRLRAFVVRVREEVESVRGKEVREEVEYVHIDIYIYIYIYIHYNIYIYIYTLPERKLTRGVGGGRPAHMQTLALQTQEAVAIDSLDAREDFPPRSC